MKTHNLHKHFILVLVFTAFVTAVSAQSTQSQCLPPTASVVPNRITFTPGDSITLSASITGTQPIEYQWYTLGTGMVKGATSTRCTLHNVTKPDTIYLRVMNDCGRKFSNMVYLKLDKK